MKFNINSLSNKLTLLIIIAISPALAILLYSGIEQRQKSIENTKRDVLLLTNAMAEKQKEITNSAHQILTTLALLPAIQDMDVKASGRILASTIEHNPRYHNMALVDTNGNVLTSGRPSSGTNLLDRKHVKEAFKRKEFAVGEFIISRIGVQVPTFPFAHPILDKEGRIKGVLTAIIELANFSNFFDLSDLPEKSFVAVTDHKGIRLFYHPAQNETNPVGEPIKGSSWAAARKAQESGIFINSGADGGRRIFAFEPVRLSPGEPPYMYVWAGISEEHVLASANEELIRNLLLLLLATVAALLIFWGIGKKTVIAPIQGLVNLTRKFAKGDFEARSEFIKSSDEFGMLTRAFHDMADALSLGREAIRDSEKRFRHIMDSLDVLVYVADMDTYEVLFINQYGKKLIGDATKKICWQSIHKGQSGPCDFCTNKYLLNEDGQPGEVYIWDFQHTALDKWFHSLDRAIHWTDGRIVRLEIATDISDRKENELIKEALIEKLEKSIFEIRTLRGILPICSFCKNIRNDQGYYEQIESYLQKHSDVDFSHTVCPDCLKKHYPEANQ